MKNTIWDNSLAAILLRAIPIGNGLGICNINARNVGACGGFAIIANSIITKTGGKHANNTKRKGNAMKTKKEIEKKMKEIEADKRINYPTATISENAPLALIQLHSETQRDILKWVLK